jgi:hypothetical protein
VAIKKINKATKEFSKVRDGIIIVPNNIISFVVQFVLNLAKA